MTVFVLGVVAFVVLFIAVLIPTLCRRRCRALLGLKSGANTNSNVAAAPNGQASDVVDLRDSSATPTHDWDVDKADGKPKGSQVAAEMGEETVSRGDPLEALGISVEEGVKLGLVSEETPSSTMGSGGRPHTESETGSSERIATAADKDIADDMSKVQV